MGNEKKSRGKYIKDKFASSINKQKLKGEQKNLISYFSKLRRASNLPPNDYYLFDLSLLGILKNNEIYKNELDLNELSNNDCYEVNHEENEQFSNDNISEMSKAFETKYDISP